LHLIFSREPISRPNLFQPSISSHANLQRSSSTVPATMQKRGQRVLPYAPVPTARSGE
jgi:hypothetical protein